MNKINRREDAVSPVIATILMVAITVVLAATLYMMVGDIGGDGVASLTARVSIENYDWYEDDGAYVLDFDFRINSMSSPSSAEIDDVDIRVLYEDGDGNIREDTIDVTEDGDGSWTGLKNGEVAGGSTFRIRGLSLEHYDNSEETLDSVELRIDGYDGVESDDF